ncbi:cold-responsive protein kinase 1 [Physcomitrium patens]|uniref:Protein kinase domain-containing protein n=1 Tax=Physcomitrium patens TaxID=3218 RepID=A0A2K1JUC6_PHYPA|nr:probable LRR receptor-like serine/threonine-protein kinase At1g56140 [Physcomitrium patens]XP_024387872.1 probable LRR receptor-like serine/threonine-protein kinase At1g56140 [Physcomitrium patens]XP_024387873.1 probable LRR receptor-like serine/threonine-protein kinase At1g56140 [Physcomitrium patens]XP_024387874.1 probable LRR receptor-like serine/threonine-protein kinase At1g56140 [Physcomitrium patens]XP_024387875.1 probable LRR receptor-like serine/threonine-protein kinase At1g56140 [Ph|eukprot:XP_024387871.1 probable LRR receptor-like serine/threonine-protein kinase At1g56140 [Physcomitrella patens]
MDCTSCAPRRALLQATSPAARSTSNLVWLYIVASVLGSVVFLCACCCTWRYCKNRRAKRPKGKPLPFVEQTVSEVLGGPNQTAKLIPYETIAQATNDFDLRQKVGDGRFGPVFQTELPDGSDVAVRRLPLNSRHGKRDFAKGVKNMAEAQHRNVVRLIGCCYTNARLLVYENLPNGNLAQHLFDARAPLDWVSRFDILLGTATGLAYLHEEPDSIFAHGGIKAGNIMLDKIMKPKIADWGLAPLFRNDQGGVKPRNMVSVGYMSPELALEGQLSAKADVFSFGILCLEVISGRQNTDINLLGTEMQTLLSWAWLLRDKHEPLNMLDKCLKNNCNEQEVLRVIFVALLCTQDSAEARPSMSRVVAMLKNEELISKLPEKPEAVKSLELQDQNVSGTFTSKFVTPAKMPHTPRTPSLAKKLSMRWGSRKQRGPSAKLNEPEPVEMG